MPRRHGRQQARPKRCVTAAAPIVHSRASPSNRRGRGAYANAKERIGANERRGRGSPRPRETTPLLHSSSPPSSSPSLLPPLVLPSLVLPSPHFLTSSPLLLPPPLLCSSSPPSSSPALLSSLLLSSSPPSSLLLLTSNPHPSSSSPPILPALLLLSSLPLLLDSSLAPARTSTDARGWSRRNTARKMKRGYELDGDLMERGFVCGGAVTTAC